MSRGCIMQSYIAALQSDKNLHDTWLVSFPDLPHSVLEKWQKC